FHVVIDSGDTPFTQGSGLFTFDGHDEPVVIPGGARRLTSPGVAARAGSHVVTFRVPTSNDAGERPVAATMIHIAEPPSALLVSVTGIEPPLAQRLKAQGVRVEIASEATCDLAPPVDVVVLGPGAGARCADDVASRVAAGTGLLVIGGEGPRGLTRLRGTALEPLLPVELPAPPPPPDATPNPPKPPDARRPPDPEQPKPVIDDAERKAMRVALLLVIDQSGSMAGLKIAMAREAAIAAARTLSPDDRVGVIAFDEETDWIAPFQDAREMASLVRRVQQLDAGGGTNFYPALKDGFARIAMQPCGVRHVVLITDGATRAAVFRDIVEGAAAQGITLSAVSVGEGADTRLLGLLAQWGQGRLYPATDPERLPQVITLDAKRFVHAPRDAAKDQPNAPDVVPPSDTPPPPADEPARVPDPPEAPKRTPPRSPRVATAAPFLAGLESATWPNLAHPEAMSVRGLGIAPLVWADGTPALVIGRASTGRCAVLAADAFSVDARELWLWSEGGRAVAQLVRSLAPARASTDDAPDVRFVALADGTAAAIVGSPGGGLLRLRPAGGGDELRAVCRPAGDLSVAALATMPAAGVWIGEFAATDAEQSSSIATGSRGAPPRDDNALADELASRSGAKLIDRVPTPRDGPPLEHREDRAPPLLAAAALLLIVDAALRRGVRG
ncbi:MAG: VWA domain-containing protein, partial [Planctomycetes bacterium]|nr:VWA domain-containing protein [Planctomycetota bacterium]